jgi:CRISPR/Cas system-associated endonuclease Cas1
MNKLLENKHALISAMALIVVLGVAMAFQGCDLQRAIKFDVPGSVQKSIEVGEQESLSNASFVLEQWQTFVSANTRKLTTNIEDAEQRFTMIQSLTSLGLGAIGEASTGFPGGAILASGLSLLTGWFLKRPGEDKRVNSEKEDSYNAGIDVGKELTSEG